MRSVFKKVWFGVVDSVEDVLPRTRYETVPRIRWSLMDLLPLEELYDQIHREASLHEKDPE